MKTPRIILATLAALAVSMLAGPVAHASITYGPIGSFGAGEVGAPFGVAVDQASGKVFVSDLLPRSVYAVHGYTETGERLTEFDQISFATGVALDPLNGHVHVVDTLLETGKSNIDTYSLNFGYEKTSAFSITGSGNLLGLIPAVQIASDSAGNIYLPNAPNNEVQKFDPEGNVLQTITGSGGEALKEPTGIAVDKAGSVYVADNGNGRVEEFSSSGAFVMAIGTGVDQTTNGSVCTAASKDTCGPGSDGSQAVALDASGDIFVGENSGAGFHVVLYSPSGEQLSDFGQGTIGTSEFGAINTLAVGPSGLVYVTDGGNNVVWIYTRQSKPVLLNESASVVKQTTGTLNATIDPGRADTTYHFEYGTSAAYGASAPVPDADIGNGLAGAVVVGQTLAGLQPGVTYHFRVVATDSVGQSVGADQTFTTPPPTPPVVNTGQASGVAQGAATLMGTVDTRGLETGYEFDLGVDTSYGTRIFGDAGSEPGSQTFVASLQGLMPGTTYHYRVLATNGFGTTYGADQTFTTATYPSSALVASGAPPLLATPLLAPAGKAPAGGASATGVRVAAHAARQRAGKNRRGRASGHKRKGRGSGGPGHAHSADRRGK